MSLDPAVVETMRIVGAAIAGAIAGGVVGEWRARAADKRAEKRDRRRLRAEVVLREISETQRDHIATSDWLVRWLAGDAEGINTVQYGNDAFPDANIYLMGDEALIRQVIDLRLQLQARGFGSGVTAEDAALLGAQQGHVSARLAAQRDRVLSGQDPIWPSTEFVSGMLDDAQKRFGIPDAFRPKLRDERRP